MGQTSEFAASSLTLFIDGPTGCQSKWTDSLRIKETGDFATASLRRERESTFTAVFTESHLSFHRKFQKTTFHIFFTFFLHSCHTPPTIVQINNYTFYTLPTPEPSSRILTRSSGTTTPG